MELSYVSMNPWYVFSAPIPISSRPIFAAAALTRPARRKCGRSRTLAWRAYTVHQRSWRTFLLTSDSRHAEAEQNAHKLPQRRRSLAARIVTGGFGKSGVPDYVGCCQQRAGRLFAIEVKRPGKEPTPLQWKRMEEIEFKTFAKKD
jgi:hypothetical protein